MTPILLGLTTVLAMLYLYHARQNKVLKTDALLPRGQWSSHRLTFLNFGLVFALGFVTMAFEMESEGVKYDQKISVEFSSEPDVEVVRTFQQEEPDLPPPPPEEKVKPKFNLLAELELVEDTEVLPDLDLIEDIPAPTPENAKEVIAPPLPPVAPPPPPTPVEEYGFITIAEVMPMFPGCEDLDAPNAEKQRCAQKKMLEYIYANLSYPKLAKSVGVEGTAVISFIVEKDGSITNPKVVRDPGAMTGQAALRAVEQFPRWIPGKQRGIPVRVQFNLPVKFKLK